MLGLGLTKLIPYLVYGALIGVVFLSIVKPKVGLMAVIPLLPFRVLFERLADFPLGKDAVDLLFLSIILGVVFKGRSQAPIESPWLLKLVRIEVAFLVLSLFIGAAFFGLGNPVDLADDRFVKLKNHLLLPILCLLTYGVVEDRRDIKIVVVSMVVALFVADFWYFNQNRDRAFTTFNWAYKGAGIFKMLGGNVLAAFKVQLFFLPLGLFFYEKRPLWRACYLGTALFTLYPILFLFSRGAYLALFVGLLYLGWVRSKLLIVALVVVAILWNTMLPVAVVERIQMTQNESGELDASASGRFELWALCWNTFLRSPLVGVGFDTFHLVSHRDDPHNIYMEMLAEQGLVGLGLFLALLAVTFLQGAWLRKNAAEPFFQGFGLAVSLIVLSCAITNLFGDRWTYLEVSAFFFVTMALAARARSLCTGPAVEQRVPAPEAPPAQTSQSPMVMKMSSANGWFRSRRNSRTFCPVASAR